MESLEEEVFKDLDHRKRREILRFVGESRGVPFTEILNATKTQDTPTLSYHLRNLAPILEQRDSKYLLSPSRKGRIRSPPENRRLQRCRATPEKEDRRHHRKRIPLDLHHRRSPITRGRFLLLRDNIAHPCRGPPHGHMGTIRVDSAMV
jgi:DNA-binding transcriptional ArsR family regulator